MKKNLTGLLIQLSNKEVASLTTVVNETLDFSFNPEKKKVFTAANLWNIQRSKKNVRSSGRYTF